METQSSNNSSLAGKARFVYVDELVGQAAFCNGKLVKIGTLLEHQVDGGLVGLVQCMNPQTDKWFGNYCISKLVPTKVDPRFVVALEEAATPEYQFQTLANQFALRKKIETLERNIEAICFHLGVPRP